MGSSDSNVSSRPFTHIFNWGNNSRRADLKGHACRIVAVGTSMRSVEIEFESGERIITSMRALRKIK